MRHISTLTVLRFETLVSLRFLIDTSSECLASLGKQGSFVSGALISFSRPADLSASSWKNHAITAKVQMTIELIHRSSDVWQEREGLRPFQAPRIRRQSDGAGPNKRSHGSSVWICYILSLPVPVEHSRHSRPQILRHSGRLERCEVVASLTKAVQVQCSLSDTSTFDRETHDGLSKLVLMPATSRRRTAIA